jgi:hypothetical protein
MEPWIWITIVLCWLAREFTTAKQNTRMREIVDRQHTLLHTLSYQLTALQNPMAAADAAMLEAQKIVDAQRQNGEEVLRRMGVEEDSEDIPEAIL